MFFYIDTVGRYVTIKKKGVYIMTQYTKNLYPILKSTFTHQKFLKHIEDPTSYPTFDNFEFIKSLLIQEYGETYAKSLYFSEDPEEAVEEALYHIQQTYTTICFANTETWEVFAEIPITPAPLTEEQEKFLDNFSSNTTAAIANMRR